MDHPLELVPVDHVSRAIVALTLDGPGTLRALHLTSTRSLPISRLGKWVSSFGFALRQLPYPAFRTRAHEWAVGAGKHHPAAAIVSMLPVVLGKAGTLDASATRLELASLGEIVPEVDERSIHLAFLTDAGALPSAALRREASS